MSEPVTQEFLDQRLAAFAQQLGVELDKRLADMETRFHGYFNALDESLDTRFAEMHKRITNMEEGIGRRLDHWMPRDTAEPAKVHLLHDD